jgi:CCR4-NOT transcription complex subunit 1
MDFTYIDALSKLITILLRTIMNRNSAEFLEKILEGIIIILTRNHADLNEFCPRPFFRIFFNLIYDFKRKDYSFTPKEITDLFLVFCKIFHRIQPLKYPGFAFCWLELISNNIFMPTLLKNSSNSDSYEKYN